MQAVGTHAADDAGGVVPLLTCAPALLEVCAGAGVRGDDENGADGIGARDGGVGGVEGVPGGGDRRSAGIS